MSDSENLTSNLSSEIATKRRNRRVSFLVAILVFVPVFAIIFLRSFSVVVTPADISDRVQSKVIQGIVFSFGANELLFGESASIRFSFPGFEDEELSVERTDQQTEYFVQLNPLPGLLKVSILAPQPFQFYADEQLIGENVPEFEIELGGGETVLSLKGEYFETIERSIEIIGRGSSQHVTIQANAAVAQVELDFKPETAILFLDGNAQEKYDGTLLLGFGEHSISVRKEGYHTKNVSLLISSGDSQTLEPVTLSPKKITANILSNPSSATILINEEYAGVTPLTMELMPLIKYELKIIKSGYVDQSVRLEPAIAKNIEKQFMLDKKAVSAEISSDVQSNVFLNGVLRGDTPLTLSVREGDLLEVKAEGYATKKIEFEGDNFARQKYQIDMIPLEEYAFVKAPKILKVDQSIRLKKFGGTSITIPQKTSIPGRVDYSSRTVGPFYIGLTEITVEEFARYSLSTTGNQGDGNLPITDLTWIEAARFCNDLSKAEGLELFYIFGNTRGTNTISFNSNSSGYRLPTLAEWQLAATDPDSKQIQRQKYYWGDESLLPRNEGNFSGRERGLGANFTISGYVDSHAGLAPVGSYSPNNQGLYDLGGNAAEWIHNYASKSRQDSGSQSHFGLQIGIEHLIKGGSFKSSQMEALEINHQRSYIGSQEDVGFRIARSIK